MAENFRGPRLKLARAETHIEYLRPLLQRFMDGHGYEAVPDLQMHPGYVTWIVSGKEQFPHDTFSPIIGDIVHNLRDSLDIAISILMRNAGKSDSGVYFPTGESRSHFEKAIGKGPKHPSTGKTPPDFPPRVVDVLETQIQPYKGGNVSFGAFLRALHVIAILDKHRLIVPTVFGSQVVSARTVGQTTTTGILPIRVDADPLPIKNGSILLRFDLKKLPPQIKIDENASITLAITFDDRCGALHRIEVAHGVYLLLNAVEYALQALETCL